MSTHDRVSDILRKILQEPALELSRDSVPASVDGWDSMTHIRLIAEIERAFKIRYSAAEISALQNFGDICDTVERKTQGGR